MKRDLANQCLQTVLHSFTPRVQALSKTLPLIHTLLIHNDIEIMARYAHLATPRSTRRRNGSPRERVIRSLQFKLDM